MSKTDRPVVAFFQRGIGLIEEVLLLLFVAMLTVELVLISGRLIACKWRRQSESNGQHSTRPMHCCFSLSGNIGDYSPANMRAAPSGRYRSRSIMNCHPSFASMHHPSLM